jgi:hypothetical protein
MRPSDKLTVGLHSQSMWTCVIGLGSVAMKERRFTSGARNRQALPCARSGFERVHLAPGETRHVGFELNPRDLSQVTEKGDHRIKRGSYTVFVAGSQPTGSIGSESGEASCRPVQGFTKYDDGTRPHG